MPHTHAIFKTAKPIALFLLGLSCTAAQTATHTCTTAPQITSMGLCLAPVDGFPCCRPLTDAGGGFTGCTTSFAVDPSISCSANAAAAAGDVHLTYPDGGRTDFRGVPGQLYALFSAPSLSIAARFSGATFFHRHVTLHGTIMTGMYVTARTAALRILEFTVFAEPDNAEIGAKANICTCGDGECAYVNSKITCDDVVIVNVPSAQHRKYKVPSVSYRITAAGWTASIEKPNSPVGGMPNFLDLSVRSLWGRIMPADPHGLYGLGFAKHRDGRQDPMPRDNGTFLGSMTTQAQGEGAIDGEPEDYVLTSPHATKFRFSRFDGVLKNTTMVITKVM